VCCKIELQSIFNLVLLFEEWFCTFKFYAFYMVLLFHVYKDETGINNKIFDGHGFEPYRVRKTRVDLKQTFQSGSVVSHR